MSTLKFIERNWGLPTLASRNHTFDVSTPTGGDYDTGGAPAPPRDGMSGLSDLFDLFHFDRLRGRPGGASAPRVHAPRCVNHPPPAPSWKTTVFSPVSSTTSK